MCSVTLCALCSEGGCGVSLPVSVIADLCARLKLHYPLVKLHWSYVWAGARKDVFVVVVL